jgi:hypothetical protein
VYGVYCVCKFVCFVSFDRCVILCDLCYVSYCSKTAHYAASRKVPGSNTDGVNFLNSPNPSGRTMALGSTQPLTEMSTRNL